MEVALARNWWSLVIRGFVAIALGIVTFAWPGITVGALVLLFGAYALIDGVVSIVGAWKAARAHERWGALIFEGIVGIAAAVGDGHHPRAHCDRVGVPHRRMGSGDRSARDCRCHSLASIHLPRMAARTERRCIPTVWYSRAAPAARRRGGDCSRNWHLRLGVWCIAHRSRIPAAKLDQDAPRRPNLPPAGSLVSGEDLRKERKIDYV